MMRTKATIAPLVLALCGAGAFALDLVKDGRPAGVIVVPEVPSATEQQAASTLARYLQMASGAEMRVVKESDLPGDADVEYIHGEYDVAVSVGRTRMAWQAGVTDEGLKHDGYRLAVKGGRLYLLGRDTKMLRRTGAQGTLRAVFGLLERLGFRWLQPTPQGTHVPKLETVSVADDLDVTYEPPFMFMHGRMTGWGDWSLANHYRTAVKMWVGCSTWQRILPPALYPEHPEFFLMNAAGERVITRAGCTDPAALRGHPQYCMSNPAAQRRVADYYIDLFEEGYEIAALGQTDGFRPCHCETCSRMSPSDQAHNAMRNVAEMVGEKHPDRLLHVLIYNPANEPPSDFESYPTNTIGHVCLTQRFQNAFGGQRTDRAKGMAYWRDAIPGGITVYAYNMGLYYSNGIAPRFTPSKAAWNFQEWAEHGVQGIYWCGGGENWGGEGPVFYVISRLAAAPGADWQAAYQEYLNLTFRAAAPAMKVFYDTLYARLDRFRHHLAPWIQAGPGHEVFPTTYSPQSLAEMRRALDRAKALAAGDDRALGWIRLAEISYDHFALIAKAFHLHNAYLLNPAPETRKPVEDAVRAYRAWAEGIMNIEETDRGFAENFFPNYRIWIRERRGRDLLTNFRWLNVEPFTWELDG